MRLEDRLPKHILSSISIRSIPLPLQKLAAVQKNAERAAEQVKNA